VTRIGAAFAASMCFGHAAIAWRGPEPEACEALGGIYDIALPEAVKRAPVEVFLHGFGSSGGGAIRNQSPVNGFLDRGYAVIAPTAGRTARRPDVS